MRQRRPADPTDPGDAADLSIMGYRQDGAGFGAGRAALSDRQQFAQESVKINIS